MQPPPDQTILANETELLKFSQKCKPPLLQLLSNLGISKRTFHNISTILESTATTFTANFHWSLPTKKCILVWKLVCYDPLLALSLTGPNVME